MSSNNNIDREATLTEFQLSAIAIGLYLVISPVHGVSAITNPILKTFNIKSPTSLLLFTGLLFGISYYYLVELVLHPLYNRIKRVQAFKSGAQVRGGSGSKPKTVKNSVNATSLGSASINSIGKPLTSINSPSTTTLRSRTRPPATRPPATVNQSSNQSPQRIVAPRPGT